MIGIRQADGSYYRILYETEQQVSRLVLRPVHDNQISAHILLYQSDNEQFTHPHFIGKIEVNDFLSETGKVSGKDIFLAVKALQGDELNVTVQAGFGAPKQKFILNIQNPLSIHESVLPDISGELSIDMPVNPSPTDSEEYDETISSYQQVQGIPNDGQSNSNEVDTPQVLRPGVIVALSIFIAVIIIGGSFLFFFFSQRETAPLLEATHINSGSVDVLFFEVPSSESHLPESNFLESQSPNTPPSETNKSSLPK